MATIPSRRLPPRHEFRNGPPARLVGLTALAFSALYLLSDVIEANQGGFSDGQLWLTFVAEAAIPVFVIGLYMVQRRRSDGGASSVLSPTRTASSSSPAPWSTR